MNLDLQLVFSEGSLLVAGFLSKKCSNTENAVLMVDSETGKILAVDSNFVTLTQRKISGKQVIQEDLYISSLLPEVDLSQLSCKDCQSSLLQTVNTTSDKTGQPECIKVQV